MHLGVRNLTSEMAGLKKKVSHIHQNSPNISRGNSLICQSKHCPIKNKNGFLSPILFTLHHMMWFSPITSVIWLCLNWPFQRQYLSVSDRRNYLQQDEFPSLSSFLYTLPTFCLTHFSFSFFYSPLLFFVYDCTANLFLTDLCQHPLFNP